MMRQRLHEITQCMDVSKHRPMLEELRAETAHSIIVLDGEAPVDTYTCAVHAFKLTGQPTYIHIATFGLGRIFAGRAFVDFLLNQGLLVEREAGSATEGDLVMYFEGDTFRHIGRLSANHRVVSKWGTGNLCAHELWELPASYGERVRYFSGPDAKEGLDLFLDYAQDEGWQFTDAKEQPTLSS